MTKLTHQYLFGNTPAQGFWVQETFKNVNSLEQFEKALQQVAFPKDPNDLNGHDPFADVLGDGFELFGEIFFKIYGLSRDIKVADLEVSPPGQIGFDFKYKHTKDYSNGAIQAKYIGKGKAWAAELRESENMKLERFQLACYNAGGVDPALDDNQIIFSNAKSLNYFTAETLLYNKVTFIGRDKIKWHTDKNLAFWNTVRNLITQSNSKVRF